MAFWSFLKNNKQQLSGKPPVTFKQRLDALENLPRFFKLVWSECPKLTLVNLLLRLVRAFQPLAMLWVAKLIMDTVVEIVSNHGNGDYYYIFQLVGIELGLAIFNDLLGRGIALTDGLIGDDFANITSIKIMQHAAKLDMNHFEDHRFYDQLERARRQTLNRSSLVAQMSGQAQEIITLIVLAAGLVVFNPWLILLLVVSVIPAFLGESHFNERSYSLIHSWTPERRELDYLRYTGSSDETAKEVKIFGLSDFFVNRYKNLSGKFYNENKNLSLKRALYGTMLSAVGTIAHYGTYAYIIYRTTQGFLTIGDLTFFMGSFARMRTLLDNIFNRFSSIGEGALYLEDLFSFFKLKPSVTSLENAKKFPRPLKQGFVFDKVGYKYPGTENWAVRNLSFELKPGEKLALVGENGAGKTTVVKLLARLYDPSEGRILLDGIDLREYQIEDLRNETGVIFQDFVKYQMTAGVNVGIGRTEAMDDSGRIKKASEMSLADTVIEKLPEKYEQMIGKKFSSGVDLSGGEWQKLALGRAYMRNAQMIILDEPTAALDARAEHEVFQRFSGLMKGKTGIIISHRFSTVRMADRILVLERGHLLEIGSHQELLEKKGRYAELFNLQAKGYQ
jgi:ATP-binding cassette, subfamily B, bacterial